MTERELDVVLHALGVQKKAGKWTAPYRSHYVAGPSDVPTWDGLVASGHARLSHPGGSFSGEMPVYVVTDAGRDEALSALRQSPPGEKGRK